MKKRLLVDIDECLREFVQPVLSIYNLCWNESVKFDEITSYKMETKLTYLQTHEGFKSFVKKFKDHIYTKEVKPFKTVIPTLKKLRNNYEIVIVSSTFDFGRKATREWLNFYKIPYDKIIFTNNKSRYKGFAMIDDCTDNLNNSKAQFKICMDKPWNQDFEGMRIKKFNELKKVLDKI